MKQKPKDQMENMVLYTCQTRIFLTEADSIDLGAAIFPVESRVRANTEERPFVDNSIWPSFQDSVLCCSKCT